MPEKKPLIEKISEKREREKKREEDRDVLLSRVEAWEEDGWDVSHLRTKIEDDVDKAKGLVNSYVKRISRLKVLNRKYRSLPLDNYKISTDAIEENLKDPRAVKKVEKQILSLKKKIKKIRKRKKFLKRTQGWKDQGYKVDDLINLLKHDLERGVKKYFEYEKNIDELDLLRKKYYSLNLRERNLRTDFDIIEIEHKLDDPSAVDELRDKIEELKDEMEIMEPEPVERQQVPIERSSPITEETSFHGSTPERGYEEKVSVSIPDSIRDWMEILDEHKRDREVFKKIRDELKDDAAFEEELIDYLEQDEDFREKFVYYMEDWNNRGEHGQKYFKVLDDCADHKSVVINSPILGSLYVLARLLNDDKVQISKNTHSFNIFVNEYEDKLSGEFRENLEKIEEDSDSVIYEL